MKKYTDIQSIIDDGIVDKIVPKESLKWLQREFIEYELGKRLILAFPVQGIYLNLFENIQGLIPVAINHTFVSLAYLMTDKLNMNSINLNINYHQQLHLSDTLTVCAEVKDLENTGVDIIGKVYNDKKVLIANATSFFMFIDKEAGIYDS